VNRIHTTVAIAGLCAVILGWQIWRSGSASPDTPFANALNYPTPADIPSASSAIEDTGTLVEPAPIDFTTHLKENTHCYVDQVVIHPDTREPVDAIACDPAFPESTPYETWSEPVLAGLAYGDPIAAEVLGLRHIQSKDPNREALGLMLLFRSVALSGDTGALHRAISQRYATVANDGEPDVHNLKQLLVFSIVATKLGDPDIDSQGLEARLAKADVPTAEVSRLKSTAERILREMASVQTEVTGNRTIEEALTNA
jgi:hypothetical protein